LELLYCGNFGHLHDLQTLVAYWQQMPGGDNRFKWRFQVTGASRSVLERAQKQLPEATQATITISGPLEAQQWQQLMLATEVALVTMKPGAERVVMPSKVYSAMLAGHAILAICPPESDLAELLRLSGAGWVVPVGDAQALQACLSQLEDPEQRARCQQRARAYALAHLTHQQLASQWAELLKGLA
jgi:glycosyltransferase involved in cell wall biosynthesis